MRDEWQRTLVLPFEKAVLVEGDPEADYQTVIFAIEAVRDNGAQAIPLPTHVFDEFCLRPIYGFMNGDAAKLCWLPGEG